MESLRIIVVDDSALFRTMIRNVLQEIPHCEVIGSAADGRTAIEKIVEFAPDLVTLDVEMPDLTGIEVLMELKRLRVRTKVVMVSRLTSAGAKTTTDALIGGAFDFVLKPSGGNPAENKAALRSALETQIQAIRESQMTTEANVAAESTPLTVQGQLSGSDRLTGSSQTFEAVVIGCSTGGPDALAQVIPYLRPDFRVPVVVVQHMPERFTASLAARLNEASELDVVEAAEGMKLTPGQVIIAKGGVHLELVRRGSGIYVRFSDAPHENGCRPAVDFTLRSAVEIYQSHLLTVILTGMGRDGLAGCRLARIAGGHVIAQHAEGCVVYGMPKAVIQAEQADRIVQLPRIATAIDRLVNFKLKDVFP